MDQQFETDYMPAESNEVLFESAHVRDKSFWREFLIYSNFRRPIVAYIVMAVSFMYSLIKVFAYGEIFWFGLIFSPLFCLLMIAMTAHQIKIWGKREMENSNGEQRLYTLKITDDKICMEVSNGNKNEIAITSVRRVVQSKHYLLLQTLANQVYPIKKDSFTKGSYEELCAFLRAKGYKVKTK